MGTTTIEITNEQKNVLDALKHDKDSYKTMLQSLIDHYKGDVDTGYITGAEAREIVNQEIERRIVPRALDE